MENELGLLADNKYEGKFVAIRSPHNSTVLACGDNPVEVSRLAAQEGVEDPLIFCVAEAYREYAYKLSQVKL